MITGKELFEMASAAEIVSGAWVGTPWEKLPEHVRQQCDEIAAPEEEVKVRAAPGVVQEV